MVKKQIQQSQSSPSSTFEIVIVLAIVAIVAITGQVLIYFDNSERSQSTSYESNTGLTGFVTLEESNSDPQISDLMVSRIEVNPASPLLGDPFEVTIYVKNNGNVDVTTPFYVDATFIPKTQETTLNLQPKSLQMMVPKMLSPGEETSVTFLVSAIMPEGPLRIIGTADASAKLADNNFANNQLSKTIIVAVE